MSKFNEVLARNTNEVAKSILDFSQTVAFSHYNNLSAQLPVDSSGKLVSGGIKEQAIQCFNNIEKIVKSINHNLNDVVRLNIFTKSNKDFDVAIEVLNSYFKDYKPALTLVAVKDIPMNASIQIEAVITCGEGTIPNAPQSGDLIKIVRNTNNAPINSYSSQTVAFSHYNHLSAQLPIDSKTNKIVDGGIEEQLKQSLRNVKNILESIDVPFDDIVKVNIYTTEINQLEKIKEVYKTFFPDSAIARAVNYLPALAINSVVCLPMDAKVQVEVTVSHGDGTPPQLVEDRHGIVIEANNTKSVFINSLSSQTVAFSHYNNISEQLPVDASGKLVSTNINEQFSKCIENLKTIVESVEHKLADVVKLNVYVENIDSISGFESILKKYFSILPAGRVIAVDTLNCKGALVKIDAIVSNAEGTPPTNK
ncbi:MAG: hypothetical protein K2I36_03265 [Ureaplasma sp.]|nr:hypothetical protein [Ureaplasma sp.]MDE7222074.1 hypothetical protein [Ureaplasma sp.]